MANLTRAHPAVSLGVVGLEHCLVVFDPLSSISFEQTLVWMSYDQPLGCLQHPDHHDGEVAKCDNAILVRFLLSEQLQQEPLELRGAHSEGKLQEGHELIHATRVVGGQGWRSWQGCAPC